MKVDDIETLGVFPRRFLRLNGQLISPGQSPVLTNLTGPASIVRGASGAIVFDFADADGDLALAILTRTDALGTATGNLPAELVGLIGASGHATLAINTATLPFGPATISVKLRDQQGLESAAASLIVQIVGEANTGTAPSIVSLAPVAPSVTRPGGPHDRAQVRFTFQLSDPDGDLAWVRLRITNPQGVVTITETPIAEFALPGTGGTVTRSLLALSNVVPLGNYAVQVTPIDRNGHAGTPRSATVSVVSAGGAFNPPRVISFSPASGPPGGTVQINGQGFSTAADAQTLVELGEVPCEIIAATTTQLTVLIPVGTRTGAFTLRNPDGSTAISPTNFQVSEHIVIEPTADEGTPEVSTGATLAFSARVGSPRADRSVTWRVNGIAGGSSALGTISPAGIYTAPSALPASPADLVQISAALAANPAVVSPATPVMLRLPPASPGAARILAAQGGSVSAQDLRSRVEIPGGALASDTTVTARTLAPAELPNAGAGRRTLGAAEFGPDGTTFAVPVMVTIPLTVSRPPGTPLRLRFFQTAGGTFIDEGIPATVNENGDAALAAITHFSIAVVDGAAPSNPPASAPTIAAIEPTEIEENARQPLRLTGTGLTSDLRVEIRHVNGTLAGGMRPETLFAAGDRAGFVLDPGVIPSFDVGTREFRVRLVRAHDDTLFADIPFHVRGLPEFELSAGDSPLNLFNPPPMRVSEVSIGAGAEVRVHSGFLDLASLGEVRILGTINASGTRGAHGGTVNGQVTNGRIGGAAGATGGRGGDGRTDEALLPPPAPDFPLPINFGQNGNDPVGVEVGGFQFPPARPVSNLTKSPRGLGGVPGANTYFSPLDTLGAIIECAITLGIACPEAVLRVIEDVRNIILLAEGAPNGKRGLGAPGLSELPTTGGGGGGGGGKVTVNAVLGGLEIYGGGGGAGGDGASNVRIRGARGLIGPTTLDGAQPVVDVRGGDGGDGSARGRLLITGPFHSHIFWDDNADAFTGGGGGGGRSGTLTVSAAEGLFLDSPYSRLQVGGGKGGTGGVTHVNVEVGFAEEVVERNSASDAEGFRGARIVHEPLFDPLAFRPRVTGRAVVHLRSAPTYNDGLITFAVRDETGGQQRVIYARYNSGTQRYEADAVLFQGFNSVSDPGIGSINDPLTAPRLLLFGIDLDGDGLTAEDEADFGTDPAVADTDGDGLNDGQEVAFGSNPLAADSDNDGLSDSGELAANTHPGAADTDGDGFQDGAEVFLGSNPNVATSKPASIPPGTLFGSSAGALALINPADGRNFALLGNPNGFVSFGLAFDELATLYTANFDRLAEYDPLAMTGTPIGLFGNDGGAPIRCTMLAYNPGDHWLYGIELGPSPGFAPTAQLLRINPFTGAATRVGPPGPFALHALVFTRTGTLFATADGTGNSDRFLELDPATGALNSTIGMTNAAPIFGLAINRQDIVFAAQPLANNTTTLLTLDVGSGLVTPVTHMSRPVFDLEIKPRTAPAFGPPVDSSPFGVAIAAGDLDLDGATDAVITSGFFPQFVTIRRGDHSGAFTEIARFQLPGFSSDISRSIALGDFNSDGQPDALVDNPASVFPGPRQLALLLSNAGAASGFDPPVQIGGSAGLRGMVTIANLNPLDDAFLDFVSSGIAANTMVTLGNGAGAFGTPVAMGGVASNAGVNGIAADMNNDGFPDLVLPEIINPGFRSAIAIRLNDGHGNFAAAAVFEVPLVGIERLRVGDFDGDGRRDVALAGSRNLGGGNFVAELVIMHQDATGAFAASATVQDPGSFSDRALAVGDLTGDGRADAAIVVIAPNTFERTLKVFAGRPDGTLRAGSVTVLPDNVYDLALADVNGDGRVDVIVTSSQRVQTYLTEPSF